MSVPETLINEALRKGIDLVDVLAKVLNLDPNERTETHLELAAEFLNEGKALINRDPIQASENLYKAAEEAIKALAIALNLDESRTALEQGRWITTLLFNAVDSISDKLGKEEVRLWWGRAWFLHVEGFHEARLSPNQVKRDLKYVEAVVKLTQEYCGH